MENVLMRFCRQTNRHNSMTIAKKLNVSLDTYRGMERGEILLTENQARELGKFYKVHYSYFHKEALQLDLLLTREAIIKILKWENNKLNKKNKQNLLAIS